MIASDQPVSGTEAADSTAAGDGIRNEIAYLRSSGALGANVRQLQLFDFLAGATLEGRAPKETEIATEVFGESPSDTNGSVARVYIHRLRRAIEQHYEGTGAVRSLKLALPKGDYRLVALPGDIANAKVVEEPAQEPASRRVGAGKLALRVALVLGALALVINVAVWVAIVGLRRSPVTLSNAPLWAELAVDDGPLIVAVGGYYMIGEYDNRIELRRLLHDFNVQSKADLVAQYMATPDTADRYSDVAIRYLPSSTGAALAELAPVLKARSDVHVKMAVELTPNDMKESDIIYVGLLNGMGSLRNQVFSHSRYKVSDNFNEIIDAGSGQRYISEAMLAAPTDTMYSDYGFVSAFEGLSGNRILVIAGAQDTALLGLAKSLTNFEALETLTVQSKGARDLEALFEVKGQKNVDLQTDLLGWTPLDSQNLWMPQTRSASQ